MTNIKLKKIRAQIEQERTDRIAEAKKIQKYCNFHGYSDVTPFEVVQVISDQTVVVREMDAVIDPDWKMEAHVGGFMAHVVNNGGKWNITSNENNFTTRARWSKAKGRWQTKYGRMVMANQPNKFYDYNF
jgi:hypothetical protein